MALAVTVNLIHGQLSYQLETNTHYVQKLQHKSLLSKLLLQHNWCAFTFFFCGKSINHCICSRQLQRGHADGGFPAVEVDPRLGEAVVVGRGYSWAWLNLGATRNRSIDPYVVWRRTGLSILTSC